MQEAKLYQKKDDFLECKVCNHFCKIKPNKVGLCGTRVNKDRKLYTLSYGYPTSLNIDPIEKKPFFHFMPGSQTFSFGTLGCNLKCDNCQNWGISQIDKISKQTEKMDYIDPEKIVENAHGDGCSSISYTYNEPTMSLEYALDIMKIAHENDLKNVWVSNGFMSKEVLEKIIPYLDAINIDIKSFAPDFYQDNCKGKLNPILENLKTLKQEQVHLEITTLIIPSLSSDPDMLNELADFIVCELDSDTPWHVTKFNPEISWKLQDIPPTQEDAIYEAYEIGKNAGLKYVYVGNIPGDQKENTYCPKCGELAIRRLGYHIERLDSQGQCAYCDRNLDIIE